MRRWMKAQITRWGDRVDRLLVDALAEEDCGRLWSRCADATLGAADAMESAGSAWSDAADTAERVSRSLMIDPR